jgi:aquaporin Z
VSVQLRRAEEGVLGWIDRDITGPIADFQDPNQEWRRLFSEFYGTTLLVLVAAGGGMMSQAFPNTITRTAAVVACTRLDGDGDHHVHGQGVGGAPEPQRERRLLAPRKLPWRRVPGYIIVQLAGATVAALFLRDVIKVSAKYGSNYPAHGYASWQALLMEAALTMGLVSVILGTASGAQNIGTGSTSSAH